MNLTTESLIQIFDRDLLKLEEEISLYPTEESVWRVSENIKNSGGNLQHYIGAILGNTDYQRNRDLEFSATGISRKIVIGEVSKTRAVVKTVLTNIDAITLESVYPVEVFAYSMTTTYFLIHLVAHLSYHLGQVNYHRRLL
jgi:hypothetical protein